MLQPNDSILVAVSGGPDSVALLRSLVMLAPENGWQLGVAHLNHTLRADAAAEESFVVSLAKELGLPCYSIKADVRAYQKDHKLSLEEAARDVRHLFLRQTAATHGYVKIALGHHANDNAELILMNLLRGSGTVGLVGMAPQRPLSFDHQSKDTVYLIRPLIHCKRKEIETFLEQHSFPFVLDDSNNELYYRRNRIRHELIPMLQDSYNPSIVDALNRMADVIDSEKTWMAEIAVPALDDAVLKQENLKLSLSISKISDAPFTLMPQLFRNAIFRVKGNLRKIGHTHIEAITRLVKDGPISGSLDLPDRLRVTRERNELIFSMEASPLRNLPQQHLQHKEFIFQYLLEGTGTFTLDNLNLQISVTEYTAQNRPDTLSAGHRVAFFDMDTLSFPLMIRNVRSGDKFTPLGMAGTQKINKFFSDHKIPADERIRCPLLLSQGRVIWVMGHRLDDSVKIASDTRRILKIALELA
jgi:tRNA(Ile)-lysidine synthase